MLEVWNKTAKTVTWPGPALAPLLAALARVKFTLPRACAGFSGSRLVSRVKVLAWVVTAPALPALGLLGFGECLWLSS